MQIKFKQAIGLLGLVILSSAFAHADTSCLLYDGAMDNAPLYRVSAPKGSLYSSPKACAQEHCAWKMKAYLVKGDVVFASQEKDGFRCAYFVGKNARFTAGFMMSTDLEKPPEIPPSGNWEGMWKGYGDTFVRITKNGGKTVVSGVAQSGSYFGSFDGTGDSTGDGTVEGPSQATASELVVKAEDCTYHLKRRASFLVIHSTGADPSQSCEARAGFDGIYGKSQSPAHEKKFKKIDDEIKG